MSKATFLSIFSCALIGGGCFFSFPSKQSSLLEHKLQLAVSEDAENVIQIGEEKKKLQDLVKDYLKTVTGAKLLANIISSALIVDFVDNKGAGAAGVKLKNELSSLRSNSSIDVLSEKEKIAALFEFGNDADLYKNYHVFQKIQDKFSDVISDFLKSSIKSDKSSLNDENNSDDTIKDLGEFLDYALDDYIKIAKPLFIRKITWKYDSSESSKEKIKKLFSSSDPLPSDFSIPSSGSYFFPVFSNETETKFSNFVKKHSEENLNLSEFSDISETQFVVPVGEAVISPSNTSQYSIALLELLSHSMSASKWKESEKGTEKSNLSTKSTNEEKNVCNNSSNHKIPTVNSDDIKDDENANKLEKIFCVEAEKNPYKTQKTQDISDFFYLKKKNKTDDKASNWIIFKDSHGVHAISVDPSVDDLNTKTKKKLLETAKDNSTSSSFKWDIKKELGGHIKKHFTRLFLNKYENISKKIENNGENTFKEMVKELVKILNAEVYSETIRSLRKNIFKDYASLLKNTPVKVNGTFKYINPSLGWAGRVPYKPGEKFLKENDPKFKDHKFVFDLLEKVYLSEFKKLSTDDIKEIDDFKETIKETFKSKVDSLFSSIASSKSESGNFFSIKSSSDPNPNNKFKNLSASNILNMVWNASLKNESFVNYLIQTEIKTENGKLNLFEWKENEKKFKESGVNFEGGTSKDLFDDASDASKKNKELEKTIIKNYLLSKHLNKLIESYDVNINAPDGDIDLSSFSDSDKLLELLKKIETQEKKLFGSSEVDLLARDNVEMFSELLTIRYLVDNKLDNFRKLLRKKLSKNNFSGFVFSRKFEPNGLCEPIKDKPTSTDAKNLKFEKNKTWDLKNKYLGYDSENITDFKCIPKRELLSVSKAKLKDGDLVEMIGHKGLYSEDIKDVFPKEIIDLISSKAIIWKDNQSLSNYIEIIKTDEEFQNLIDKLKFYFSDIDWSIAEQKTIFDYSGVSYNWQSETAKKIQSKGTEISLDNRKKILQNFLKQNNKNAFKINYSWTKLKELQEKLQETSEEGKQQLLTSDKFNRFYGWITEGNEQYLVKDKNNNKYSIFFVQVKYSDLDSDWTNFLKKMPDDLIIKEVIKSAKDKSLQNQAMYYYLQEDSNKMKKFTAFDDRLKKKIDFKWAN